MAMWLLDHHPSSTSHGMLLRLGKSPTCLLSRCMTVTYESGAWQRSTALMTLQRWFETLGKLRSRGMDPTGWDGPRTVA
ncbi:Uncharacterized protein HZ326_27066 [Fusarium oxysporum f. sp. albedinis]|nr:Uncharacterized protein HZ326_27066 [Fusarium oxysporum f. sp. albedinis]